MFYRDCKVKAKALVVRENRKLEAYDNGCRDMKSDSCIWPIEPMPEVVCDRQASWELTDGKISYRKNPMYPGDDTVADIQAKILVFWPEEHLNVIDSVDDDGRVNFHKEYFIRRQMTDAEFEFCLNKQIELMQAEQQSRLGSREGFQRIMRDGIPAED